jgi:hypothetical protein
VRFLENHDEPHAASAFPLHVHRAAALVAFLVPGLRFFQKGQLEGWRVRVSMHLGRRPTEPTDPVIKEFYQRLLEVLLRPVVRQGQWRQLECRPAWRENRTWNQFVALCWEGSTDGGRSSSERPRLICVVNYGPAPGQCYVSLPFGDLRGNKYLLRDLMGPARYERAGDDLASRGLYVDMPEWGYHVFDVVRI